FRVWMRNGRGGEEWMTAGPIKGYRPGDRPPVDQYPTRKAVYIGPDRKTISFVVANDKEQAGFAYSPDQSKYGKTQPYLPPGARLGDGTMDYGLRFIDIDEDGNDDVVFSNEKEYGVYLFTDMEHGWSKKVMAGKAGDEGALPPIAVNGKNNGFFVHSRSLWWQNEHTNLLKDHVDRRSFNELLMKVDPTGKSP